MLYPASVVTDALIERVRAGDERAYETIVLEVAPDLVRFTTLVLGGRRDDADDVVQDVIVRLWARREHFPDLSTLRPYLYRAVRNRAIDNLRSQQVRQELSTRYQHETALAGGGGTHGDIEGLFDKLEEAVGTLTNRQRMVLMLRYEQGMTHAQVADVLGVSLRAAEQLAKRALLALRQYFSGILPDHAD